MKLVSTLLTLVIIAVCVIFAVNNTQEISLNLSPLEFSLNAPVYLITVGTFFAGFLLGAFLFWVAGLYPRWQRRNLAKETDRLKQALLTERGKNTSTAVQRFEG